MPQGTAKDVGTVWWQIVDGGGNRLASFDHQEFSNIRNGATVTYVDADGDGIAEIVQPAAAVARYTERAVQGRVLDDEKQALVLDTIMSELKEAAGEAGADRQKRLRRLRATLDSLDI